MVLFLTRFNITTAVCFVSVSSVVLWLFFYSIVHIVSALEHPSSAVRRGVIARTITPARGPPAPFRTSGGALSCVQSTLSWPSANVRTVFIFWSFYSIQVYLYSAFYDTIVAKQLYRKLSFYNICIYCRNLIYLTKFGNSVCCLRVGILWGPLRGWHHLFSGVLII